MDTGRDRWAGRLPFVMAAVGSAVGLGNIWRFPKAVFENGGGVFLIPYFVALVTAGIPLMIVEYALGQKYQGGAPKAIAAVTKKFRWVGWFAIMVGTVITFYYIVIMAWAFQYAGASFNLSWAKKFDLVEYELDKEKGTIKQNITLKENIILYQLYNSKEEEDRLRALHDEYNEGKQYEDKIHVLSPEDLGNLTDKEKAKDESEEKIKWISFEKNVDNYLKNKTLDFHPDFWAEVKAYNDALDKTIQEIKKNAKKNNTDITKAQEREIKDLKAKKISYFSHMMKPSWHLFLGAFVTWLAIFLIISKGIKTVGKVVMFTVPIPIIIILIIIIRGMTLPGAWKGIEFYLSPNWDLLFAPKIWMAAYGQIFFSLSLGFGVLIAYASYMPHDSDITNNAFLTSFANCSTSFLGGFAVFSVLGYLAFVKGGIPVEDVASSGITLAFVTYPTAIAQMGIGWGGIIIGFIFFVCLLSLGIDSAFSILEGAITAVKDHYLKVSKALLTAIFCFIGFLATSFIFASRSGLMWLDIADNWMSNYGLPLVGLFECLAIGYFSDLEDLKKYINKHSEIKVHYWFDVCIKVVTPTILIYLLSRQLFTDISQVYGGYDAILSWSVSVAGWGLFSLLIILATIIAKNYHLLVWEISSIAVYLIFYAVFKRVDIENPAAVSAMATLGSVLLLGGFFSCLYIAMTEKLPAGEGGTEPPEDVSGPAKRELSTEEIERLKTEKIITNKEKPESGTDSKTDEKSKEK